MIPLERSCCRGDDPFYFAALLLLPSFSAFVTSLKVLFMIFCVARLALVANSIQKDVLMPARIEHPLGSYRAMSAFVEGWQSSCGCSADPQHACTFRSLEIIGT